MVIGPAGLSSSLSPCQSVGMTDDLFPADEDDDEEAFLAAWDAADRAAAQLLREALPEATGTTAPEAELIHTVQRLRLELAVANWPYSYFDPACEWKGQPPDDDHELYMAAVAATISPVGDPGWPVHDQAAVMTLEHVDWAGATIGLVRAGVGAPADPQSLIRYIAECPDVDGDIDSDDELLLGHAFDVLMPLWEALTLIDENPCITALGIWAIPHALLATWDPQN